MCRKNKKRNSLPRKRRSRAHWATVDEQLAIRICLGDIFSPDSSPSRPYLKTLSFWCHNLAVCDHFGFERCTQKKYHDVRSKNAF